MTTISEPVLAIIKRIARKALWSDDNPAWSDMINGDKFLPLEPEDIKAARAFLEEQSRIPLVSLGGGEAFVPLPQGAALLEAAAARVAESLGSYDPDRAAEEHRQRCEGEATMVPRAYHVRAGSLGPDRADLGELIRLSIQRVAQMSPVEREEMIQAQRESWARSCISKPSDRQPYYHKAEVAEPLTPQEVEQVRRILLQPPVVPDHSVDRTGCTTPGQAESLVRRQRQEMFAAVERRSQARGRGHG